MKIVVTNKKGIRTLKTGRLPAGRAIELDDYTANFFIQRGDAVLYETKEKMDAPLKTDGAMAPSSVAPAAQVSTEKTSTESENGEKPKRKKSEPSSSPTQHSE